jgi:putative ABC transport system permease protein
MSELNGKSFSAVAAIDLRQLSFALIGSGPPRQIAAARITPGFFDILGASPLLGHIFSLETESNGTAIISYQLWKDHFHSDRAVLGKRIDLDGVSYTVVAVMPESFRFPIRYQDDDLEVWMPESLDPIARNADQRTIGLFLTLAKLPTGSNIAEQQGRLNSMYARYVAQSPDIARNRVISLYALDDELAGSHRTELLLLLGAVTVLLLIACTNVASLLFARGNSRAQEMAVRVALGAGRRVLLRQLFIENILLACCGAFCAVFVAIAGVHILSVYMQAQPGGYGFSHLLSVPSLGSAGFPITAFLFMAGILTITILLAGLSPALTLSRADGLEAMKGQFRTSSGRQAVRWRAVLLTGQISLSLVLAIAGVLLIRSFERLVTTNPGFEVEHRLTYQLTLPSAKYPSGMAQARFYQTLLEKTASLPGVQSAAVIGGLPLTTWLKQGQFLPDSLSVSRTVDMPSAQNRSVSANYFEVMGIPFLSGHSFGKGTEQNPPKEIVISESLAHQYWPHDSAVGHFIRFDLIQKSPTYTIVGVVGDVHQNTLDKSTGPEYYVSYWNDPDRSMGLVLRTKVDKTSMQRTVEAALHSIDPDQPFAHVASFNDPVQDVSRPLHTRFMLFSIISGIALLLVSVGIFGLISYLVAQRTREIGIRMALGAGRWRVVLAVLEDALKLVGLGICIGGVIALSLSWVLKGLLFEVSPWDWMSYATASVVVVVLAIAACIVPAYWASRIHPSIALRTE